MGRVIAVTNQKGGVGKTTTAINLAASLASLGVRTLLVDCDPQSNASSGVGFSRDPNRLSTYQVVMGEVTAAEASSPTEVENLSAIPAHKNLIGANIELVPLDHREYRLRYALEPVRQDYEFIILDCPPALDLLTLNALVAADAVLIPMQAEYFALEGVTELLDTIERIKHELNQGLVGRGRRYHHVRRSHQSGAVGRGGLARLFWRSDVRDDDSAQYPSGRGPKPRQAGVALRSTLARMRGLSSAGAGNREAGEASKQLSLRRLRSRKPLAN